MRTLLFVIALMFAFTSAHAGVLNDLHAAGKEHGAVLDNGTFPLPIWVSPDADSVTVDRRLDGLIVWYLVENPYTEDELQAPPILRLKESLAKNFTGEVEIYTKIRSGHYDTENSRIVFIRRSGKPRAFLDAVEMALNNVFPGVLSVKREQKQ